MPVLSAPSSSRGSSTYTFLELALLITVTLALSRRIRNARKSGSSGASPSQSTRAARILSALPQKNYLLGSASLSRLTTPTRTPMQHESHAAQEVEEAQVEGKAPEVPSYVENVATLPSPAISDLDISIHMDLASGSGTDAGASRPRIFPHPSQLPPLLFNPVPRDSTSSLIQPSPPSPSLSMIIPPSQGKPAVLQSHSQSQFSWPHQMILVPSPTEYTSFEALYSKNPPYHQASSPAPPLDLESHGSSTPPTTAPSQADLPARRRSYTRSFTNGSEVAGEIVVSSSGVEGQSWRRHTRVFGGGVCQACEESERRMSA